MKLDMVLRALIAVAIAIVCAALLVYLVSPGKHDYLVIYESQTNGEAFWSTHQRFARGTKFTLTDEHWFRTNEMAGNTNMAIVILNIIKLDD